MQELITKIREFAKERDWEQFHNPKDLSMALSIEAAELQEIFLWMSSKDSMSLNEEKYKKVKQEIGDVLIFLLRLCDVLKIDPIQAGRDKLKINVSKYPVQLAKGNSQKYTEFGK